MKRILPVVLGLAVLASCSTPRKYTYYFDHHKYQSVNKNPLEEKATRELTAVEAKAHQEELKVSSEELVATVEESAGPEVKNPVVEKAGQLAVKYKNLRHSDSKSEKKALRQELKHDLKSLKKDLKEYVKTKKDGPESTTAFRDLDKNLRIAIVFAIAAVIASIVAYPIYPLWYVASILWLVSLIFLIIWLVDQA